jgi:hypothetical protein
MQTDLDHNYADAVASAESRGVRPLLDRLAVLLSSSVAVIAVPADVLLKMTMGAAYRSYHKALDQGLRPIAEKIYHRHRTVVDAAMHAGYYAEITTAAISTDGRGLNNYGTITLRIGERFIANRATVLRENAFEFYKRYNLGDRDALAPSIPSLKYPCGQMSTQTGLTTLAMPAVMVVAYVLPMATIRTVHKSPSLTVAGNWLSTVVSGVVPTVSGTIRFR